MLGEEPLMRVCVEACPLGTYLNTSSRQCVPCHDGCQMQAGCAGPLPYVNRTHGCLECDRVQLDREGKQVSISNHLPAPFYTVVMHYYCIYYIHVCIDATCTNLVLCTVYVDMHENMYCMSILRQLNMLALNKSD